MSQTYSKEQFWKLYEKLPQELKDALWTEETGNNIYETCQRYEISDHLEELVQFVGAVLTGLMLPQNFAQEIEKLGVEKETAGKVAREINRFVFYPVKPALEQLHKMEIEVSARVVTPEPPLGEAQEQGKKDGPKGPDSYREPIE